MTVHELINQLRNLNPNNQVYFRDTYGIYRSVNTVKQMLLSVPEAPEGPAVILAIKD